MTRLTSFAGFLRGVRTLIDPPLSLEKAQARIRRRIENRESAFLDIMDRTVYGRPSSPYRELLRLAQCEAGDLRQSVAAQGLEGTLDELARCGVYLSLEEFKGRRPIVRAGLAIEARPEHFDMPGLRRSLLSATGGSTGKPVWLAVSIDRFVADLPILVCADVAAGLRGAPTAIWYELLPAPPGVATLLYSAGMDNAARNWFFPPSDHGFLRNARSRVATELVLSVARRAGRRMPHLERLPLDSAVRVAAWAQRQVAEHGRCVINTIVSHCIRVSVAARRAGIELTGTTFIATSESLTAARRQEIRSSGAETYPWYFMMETGCLGVGCANPTGNDDLHFSVDRFALRARRDLETGLDALFVTSLDPRSPRLMLNVQTGDHAIVDNRSCGCDLERLGLTTLLQDVSSVTRLTTEGETLMVRDLARIVEDVLPNRFGGTALDYQLVEEEQEGITRLNLLISPDVHVDDESDVHGVVLEALRRGKAAVDVRVLWGDAGTLRIRRRSPMRTESGKQLPVLRAR